MEGLGSGRRSFLKAGVVTGAAAVGLPLFSGSAAAWKGIDIDINCVKHRKLAFIYVDESWTGKDEFEDHRLYTGHGVSYNGETDNEYSFSTPEGDASIELTPGYNDDGDIVSFSYDTNGIPISKLVVATEEGLFDLHKEYDVYYRDTETKGGKRNRDTPIIRDSDLTVDDRVHEEIWFLKIYYCTVLKIRVKSTYNSDDPTNQIDLTDDDVRFGLWWGPRHYDDQYVFDNGVEPINGNGSMYGDELIFYFPVQDAYINDPAAVNAPEKIKAELLIKDGNGRTGGESEGTTWAGERQFPLV
jgi:hypothetical protein